MGRDRASRFWRSDSTKRTIMTAAMRREPAPPRPAENLPPNGDDDVDGGESIDEDLSELVGDGDDYETLVVPLVTLPTLPAIHASDGVGQEREAQEEWEDAYAAQQRDSSDDALARPRTPRLPPRRRAVANAAPGFTERESSSPQQIMPGQARTVARREPRIPVRSGLSVTERLQRLRSVDVMLVPGGNRATGSRVTGHDVSGDAAARFAFLRTHRLLLVVLTFVTVLSVTVTTAVSTGQVAAFLAGSSWQSLSGSGAAPTPTLIPAPDILDTGHYVAKYGFDWPKDIQPLPDDERQRMIFMLPAAYKAASAYDQRYHQSIEPELIVWWTHAEGIGARINYSNCANHPTRPGTDYFTNIENCPVANFWQLGYGNQFSVIYVLKNAFSDLYGNPNDTKLVQKVGQWVLDFDQQQGTVPKCGGYACAFPAKTIDEISAGIDQTTGAVTEDNWWASVLSRDPAINCYMVAHALTFFNHDATRNWVGCYYAEPCWGYESNRLGDVLTAWPGLRRAASI